MPKPNNPFGHPMGKRTLPKPTRPKRKVPHRIANRKTLEGRHGEKANRDNPYKRNRERKQHGQKHNPKNQGTAKLRQN
jgi:hypothetical protein